MTDSNGDNRLDRIEALLKTIGQRLEETRAIANFNAKSVEAISNERKEFEREISRDRARLYQFMYNLASAQTNLTLAQANMATTHAEFQSNFYARQEDLD